MWGKSVKMICGRLIVSKKNLMFCRIFVDVFSYASRMFQKIITFCNIITPELYFDFVKFKKGD